MEVKRETPFPFLAWHCLALWHYYELWAWCIHSLVVWAWRWGAHVVSHHVCVCVYVCVCVCVDHDVSPLISTRLRWAEGERGEHSGTVTHLLTDSTLHLLPFPPECLALLSYTLINIMSLQHCAMYITGSLTPVTWREGRGKGGGRGRHPRNSGGSNLNTHAALVSHIPLLIIESWVWDCCRSACVCVCVCVCVSSNKASNPITGCSIISSSSFSRFATQFPLPIIAILMTTTRMLPSPALPLNPPSPCP